MKKLNKALTLLLSSVFMLAGCNNGTVSGNGDNGGQGNEPKTEWSSQEKAMMVQYIGEVLPFMEGTWTWTDAYYEEYDCITAEGPTSDLDKAKVAYDNSNFEYLGYDELYESYSYSKPCANDSNYVVMIDIYLTEDLSGNDVTAVDAYLETATYEEWPTDLLAEYLDEIDINVTIPPYTGTDFFYTLDSYISDDLSLVYVIAYSEDALASDYAVIVEQAGFVVTYDEYNDMYTACDTAKTVTIMFYDSSEYYAVEIYVTAYIADYLITLDADQAIVEVGETYTVGYTLGSDYEDSYKPTFTSSNTNVATVNEEGVVTPVAAGNTTITVAGLEGNSATVDLTVVAQLPKNWSEEQIAEIKKLVNSEVTIPFYKLFTDVEYLADEGDGDSLIISSSYVSNVSAFDEYLEILESNNAVDISEEYGIEDHCDFDFYFTDDYDIVFVELPIAFYRVEMGGHQLDLQICILDEDGYMSDEGSLTVFAYDPYTYEFADITDFIASYLADGEFTTTMTLPEIDADFYYVEFGSTINVTAYETEETESGYKEKLEQAGWSVEKVDVPADEEEGIEAYSYYEGTYEDATNDVEFTCNFELDEGNLYLSISLPLKGYSLVTSIDDLQVGDLVVFGCAEYEAVLGDIGSTNKYFDVDEDSILEDGVVISETALVFEVGKEGDYYTFEEVTTGTYLTCQGEKNVCLGGSGDKTWTVSIASSGNATITSTKSGTGTLQYNSTDPRFTTYKSNQKSIQIYKA